MANHFKDEKPVQKESRAAIRARQEAEEREKREWIARRMKEDQEAAEKEAREKAAWIAERKRQEREKEQARLREEKRAEEAALRREKEAKEAERQRKAKIRREKSRRVLRKVKLVTFILMLVVLVAGTGWLIVSHRLDNSDKNLSNVYVDGIDVSGLTREETEKKLEEAGWNDPATRILRVELPVNVSFELDREEAGLVMSREEAAQAAFDYGRGADQMENVGTYLGSGFTSVDLAKESSMLDRNYVRQKCEAALQEFRQKTSGESIFMDTERQVLHFVKGAGQMDIDLEKLCAAAEEALLSQQTLLVFDQLEGKLSAPNFRELQKQVSIEPVDASFSEHGFDVIEGKPGLSFDVAEARRLWLAAAPMQEILIPLQEVQPKVTAETLKQDMFKDCLGSQTSSFGGSTRARVNNINLATEKINGIILMPGETFSYNGTVGERTIGRGFQEAAAYSNGEVVQEVGGGICQVSSTLYCASLYSRMTIVDRTNHYFRVTYLPLGQDATVSWDEPDFKFRNDREYPVKIVAWCDNDAMQLTVEIWGTDTDGIWVSLSYEQYAVHDSEYTDVVVGSNVYLWITYHDANGNVIETREGPASTYHRHDYEIDWPPEKFKKDEEEGGEGGGEGQVIIDDGGTGGGETGGGETGGGETGGGGDEGGSGGGETGGGETGGGETGGGETGDVIIEP